MTSPNFYDSQSVISAVKQYSPFHLSVRSIQDWLRSLHFRRKNISFCLVPAHVGIPENETADQIAKRTDHLGLKFYGNGRRYGLALLLTHYLNALDRLLPLWESSFPPDVVLSKALTRLRIGQSV